MENKEQIQEKVQEKVAEMVAEQNAGGCGEFVLRMGDALPVKEPVKVSISGVIDSPARWLEKRMALGLINQSTNHVTVNREKMFICLRSNENNPYGSEIIGELVYSDIFNRFEINTGETRTTFEMADLIKMNRSFFENKQVAMKLVAGLQNIKASVNKTIEASDDRRGNKRSLIDQVVASNIPSTFELYIPIFKGVEKKRVECEVYIDEGLNCQLISPEVNDLIESMRNVEIDSVIDRINAVCPDIVIIEQ